jgi:hypothetical protein
LTRKIRAKVSLKAPRSENLFLDGGDKTNEILKEVELIISKTMEENERKMQDRK